MKQYFYFAASKIYTNNCILKLCVTIELLNEKKNHVYIYTHN